MADGEWRMANGEWRMAKRLTPWRMTGSVSTGLLPARYSRRGGHCHGDSKPDDGVVGADEGVLAGRHPLYSSLPREAVAQILGRQLVRSATSVGAQYREAQRAKSIADVVSKTEGALQEVDEAGYWLELIEDSKIAGGDATTMLREEATELLAILVAITRKAKSNKLRK